MSLSIDSAALPQYLPAQAGRQAGAPAPGGAGAATGDPTGASSGDQAVFSEEGLRKAGLQKANPTEKTDPRQDAKQTAELENLRQRDREVRAHEQAHVAAGGSLVRGAASFGYKAGPDGQLYAVSGEVSIDTSPVDGDARATMRKMDQVRKAALAPAQPSGQDRAVASAAAGVQVNAQHALNQEQAQQSQAGESATPAAAPAEQPKSKPGGTQSQSGGTPNGPVAPKSAASSPEKSPALQAAGMPQKSMSYKPVNLWA